MNLYSAPRLSNSSPHKKSGDDLFGSVVEPSTDSMILASTPSLVSGSVGRLRRARAMSSRLGTNLLEGACSNPVWR